MNIIMNKDKIKIKVLVKESLAGLFEKSNGSKETKAKSKVDAEEETSDSESGTPLDQRDQVSIKNIINAPLSPSKTDVCVASGLAPDAHSNSSSRSACIKKLDQTDGQGLDDDELNAVSKVTKAL